MSEISRLLIEQARNSAAAREASGAAWGTAVSNISQIPGQVLNAYAQQRGREQSQALAVARETREAGGAADEHQLRVAQLESMRQKQAGDWAEKLRVSGATPEIIGQEIDAQVGKLWTPQEAAALKATASTPEGAQQIITRLAPVQEPKVSEVDPTKDVIDKRTGKVIRKGTVAGPKTPTELAIAAADPNNPLQAQYNTALDLSKPPKPEPVSRPLDQQLLEAVVAGDTVKVGQIKQTLLTAAQARQDPDAAAMARSMAGLRVDEAKARLATLEEKNKPLDITPDVQTTRSGKTYIDLSQYSAGERDKARKAASDVGAVPLSKEQANALQEIDNARANQKSINDQIGDLLPKSVAGRGAAALTVPLEKVFQTNDQIAAYNSWRTAAIQTLRATAGSKGLRINQAEIAQAIENDIPKLTDTVGVAQQKLKNINTLLDNAESSIVVRDRKSQPAAAAPASVGPTYADYLKSKGGK